jgi:hypothetical protein
MWFSYVVPYRWRWAHRWWSNLLQYYWLPCPLCGQMFSGHESHEAGECCNRYPSGLRDICSACHRARKRRHHKDDVDWFNRAWDASTMGPTLLTERPEGWPWR